MISFLTFYYMHDIVMWVIARFYFRWINSWNGQKMMFISWWVQNKKWSHEQTAWPSSTVCGFPQFELIQLVKEVDWHDEVLSQICRIFFNRHNCIVWNANIISHFKTLKGKSCCCGFIFRFVSLQSLYHFGSTIYISEIFNFTNVEFLGVYR